MIYKGKNFSKVLSEIELSLNFMICPHHKKFLQKMAELKYDVVKKELKFTLKQDVICCKKAGEAIRKMAWRVFAQN